MCVAALGVLRAAARRRPVLAVVDDVQWVDASSRELHVRSRTQLVAALAERDRAV